MEHFSFYTKLFLDNEEHVSDIDYLTTLAGFIHLANYRSKSSGHR